jgi:parallel beta-helix repeat protein
MSSNEGKPRVVRKVLGLLIGTLGLVSIHPTATPAQSACTKYVSQVGQDSNVGSELAPFATISKLFQSLTPGQTGCARGGDSFSELINMVWSGSPGQPITLQSYGTGRAEFIGQIHVLPTTHNVTFRNLRFGGLPTAPKATHLNIDGDYVEIRDSEITNPSGICVDVGAIDAYQAITPGDPTLGFVLDNSRVHDCGNSSALVWTDGDSGAHGVYLINTVGAELSNNIIFNNEYRGIQLWPKAEQTNIHHNVLDGSATNLNIGSALTDGYPWHSVNTSATNNIITNATLIRPGKNPAQVYGNFPNGSAAFGNIVTGNCLFHPDPSKNFAGNGFSQTANIIADPLYINRTAKDFRLASNSPCIGKGPGSIQPGGQAPTAVTLSSSGIAQTVDVTWAAPIAAAGITFYRVTLTPAVGSVVYQWVAAANLAARLYGVAAGVYTAKVEAYGSAGLSPASASSSALSVIGISSAPTGLVATSPSTGSVSLQWTPGVSGGEARPYSYTLLQNNTTGFANNLWAAGETNANLYGLPGGNYTVATSQYGASGIGARSLRQNVTVVGLPSAPRAVSVSAEPPNGARVEWVAPMSNGGSPILYYRVTLNSGVSTLAPLVIWVNASQLSSVVPSVPGGGPWTAGVAAYTAAGIGGAGLSTTSVVSPGGTATSSLPASVSGVVATTGPTNGQVTVNWSVPVPYNSGSGALAYFRVVLQHGGGGGPHFQWVTAAARSATFYGFPGGVASAQVVAYNANGEFGVESSWSPPTTTSTISYLAPYSLGSSQPNSISISPSFGGSSALFVRLIATPISSTGVATGPPTVAYLPTLGGLGTTLTAYGIPTGRYSVMVEPYNANGYGWSEEPFVVVVT